MLLGIDPKVDFAFKWLMGNEKRPRPAVNLLNAILSLEHLEPVTEIQILNPFTEKMALDDKLSILDIKVRDQLGRQANVEMQMTVPLELPQRIVYYWGKLHTGQLHAGEDYRLLKPTYSICFVNGVMFPDSAAYHHAFRLVDAERGVTLTGDLVIHFFELPKFNLTAEQLRTPLEVWLYFFIHAAQLDPENLPETLNREEIREAMSSLKMLTEDDIQRELYEGRMKALSDAVTMRNALQEALDKAAEVESKLAEAQTRAVEAQTRAVEAQTRAVEAQANAAEALERGALIGRVELLQRLLQRPATPREDLDAMPMAELSELAVRLEQELSSHNTRL